MPYFLAFDLNLLTNIDAQRQGELIVYWVEGIRVKKGRKCSIRPDLNYCPLEPIREKATWTPLEKVPKLIFEGFKICLTSRN